jgi:hypothetical protein
MAGNIHLILDLDGTLIDGDEVNVFPRPYLQEFLDFCFSRYASVSIWTAASREWLDKALRGCLAGRPFLFTWTGERCTVKYQSRSYHEVEILIRKKLAKVWRAFPQMTKHNTFILDDTPSTYRYNYGNVMTMNSRP